MREIPTHKPCFGRNTDLARLIERVQKRGVTFVMAPPRMGKTWLVRNLAFEWAANEGWNIGYAISSGGKNDLLREVVFDLYKRWLGDATLVAQASSLWTRHKDQIVTKIGIPLGKALGKIATLANGDWTVADKAIDQTFNALTRAEQDLRTGGMMLDPITYEDARDLVATIAAVTQEPTLLIMDAWEQGQDFTADRGSIQKLLDNEDQWPDAFHLIVVIRDKPEHLEEVQFAANCCTTYPSADSIPVDQLNVENLDEQDRLLHFLRDKVPAVAHAERDWVIEQCATPAVIEWWLRRKPADHDALVAEAANAQNTQYAGLFDLIEQTQGHTTLFNTTVRLAMLPEITSAQMWQPYRDLIDATDPDPLIADLQSRRILNPDEPDYPSFGHTTAYDAVRTFLLRPPPSQSHPDPRPQVRAQLRQLIRDLAGRVRSTDLELIPIGTALVGTSDPVRDAALDDVWQWPARLAKVLFGHRLTAAERQQLMAESARLDDELPSARVLLSMGLYNTLCRARAEQDFAGRDAVLVELRRLTRGHSADAAVRSCFAKGLYNTLNRAKDKEDLQRRDALLAELRQLAEAYPEDGAVRNQLGKGLHNTLRHARREQAPARYELLLAELRRLTNPRPPDPLAWENLARGLTTVLIWAREDGDMSKADALLAELRNVLEIHPENDRLDQGRAWLAANE